MDPLIKLRIIVAFLGEKKQFGWWDTSFLDATGRGFLERPFPRTASLAALRSASEAGCRTHDASIGRVGVFHLFRLPIDQEEAFDLRVAGLDPADLNLSVQSKTEALACLGELQNKEIKAVPGPIHVGSERQITTHSSIAHLAATYYAAFKAGAQTFPYFAKESHV